MIRLAVTGDEAMWHEVVSRLHGATVEKYCDFSRDPAPPEACDAILLVNGNRPEVGLIERCLTAKKHVLLVAESWLSSDVLETFSVLARQNRVQFAVVNPDRFHPSRQLIRQQLDASKLGEPGLVRMHRWESATAENLGTLPGLPSPLLRDVELALSLMGKPPNVVYAVEPSANVYGSMSGRMVQVHLGFLGGGMALIDYADCLPPGDGYLSLSVIGSAGAAYADDHQNMQLVYRGGRPQSERVDEGGRQLAALVQEFVEGINANHDFSATLAAWRRVLAVVDCVQRSLVARQAISLES